MRNLMPKANFVMKIYCLVLYIASGDFNCVYCQQSFCDSFLLKAKLTHFVGFNLIESLSLINK
jgi:hypothetical protein